MDHRRTWRYAVKGTPNQCVDAFFAAFSGSGGLIAKADWQFSRRRNGAAAVYKGRKGLGALGGVLSKTSALEQSSAVGSTVNFEIEESKGEHVVCAMWLGSSGRAGVAGLLGVTSDARFIRPYMRAVEDRLRSVDPHLRVGKGLASATVEIPEATPEQEELRRAEWTEAVAAEPGEMWTCPVCGYAKNPGGRVRCAQCRTEIGPRV
ncbi:MAG TPA: hypothetical protein VF245_09580 [Solirubrobacterales bacterium]